MQRFRFEDEEALRAQHMTEDEAKSVVALWAEREREREKLASMTSVQDLAEGLQIPPEEAQRLLQTVRARKQADLQVQERHHQRTVTPLRAMAIAATFAVLLLLLLGLFTARPVAEPAVVSAPPAAAVIVSPPPAAETVIVSPAPSETPAHLAPPVQGPGTPPSPAVAPEAPSAETR